MEEAARLEEAAKGKKKGGGKPDRAQDAAKDASNFVAALAAAQGYASSK